MIETAAQQLKSTQAPTQVFLPYTLIDNLCSALEDGPFKTRLSDTLQNYFNFLDQPVR